jgi:hypothetical protein
VVARAADQAIDRHRISQGARDGSSDTGDRISSAMGEPQKSGLLQACETADASVVDVLLNAGADANSTRPEGETALMVAARTGKSDVVKALVAGGANVDAKESWRGQTALMWAAGEDHDDVIKTLAKWERTSRCARPAGLRPCSSRSGRDGSVPRGRSWNLAPT